MAVWPKFAGNMNVSLAPSPTKIALGAAATMLFPPGLEAGCGAAGAAESVTGGS
jgi:hypothetical protein